MISWVCFPEMTKCIFPCKTHTESNTWTHTRRHGGKIKKDHGKGIFSMLSFVSPGRQDWWRDGSISCSINAFCLKGCAWACATQGRHHVTSQRSQAGRCGSVWRVSHILPLSVAVSSYSLVEGSAGTSGSMFMMRFLWLRELKLRLWPNWALKAQKSTLHWLRCALCSCVNCCFPTAWESAADLSPVLTCTPLVAPSES